jgi:hypothetical protein
MNFGLPPEDLDYSIPLEPMRMSVVGEAQDELKELLAELVQSHATKLTRDQKDDLRSVYRQILLNVIYNSSKRIYSALPRGTQAFQRGTYWSKLGLTYKLTVAALDRLVEDGYIVQMKGFYNPLGGPSRLTRIFATDKLAAKIDVQKVVDSAEFLWDNDSTPVVLTDFPYKADSLAEDHPDVMRVRAINKFLKDHIWPQRGPVRVIYKDTPVNGGRVYTRFQNMPKEHRREMLIDGKEVVELDYKSNHLAMLMAIVGLSMTEDPYKDIAAEASQTRDMVKKFVTVSLGASSEEKAFGALKKHRFNRALFNKIRDSVWKIFPGVPLFGGFGTMLQSLEGQIVLDIMYEGAKSGIVVLPVHDSFITTPENKRWLWDQMADKWPKHVVEGRETRIEEKY